jgi:hypothetical protein
MPGWSWVIIWLLLTLGALGFFAYLALELAAKSKRLLSAAVSASESAEPLLRALDQKPELPVFEGDLLSDVAPLAAKLTHGLRLREARRLTRQRRLINKLIELKAEESEFLP